MPLIRPPTNTHTETGSKSRHASVVIVLLCNHHQLCTTSGDEPNQHIVNAVNPNINCRSSKMAKDGKQ
jgi:hypothetical protein